MEVLLGEVVDLAEEDLSGLAALDSWCRNRDHWGSLSRREEEGVAYAFRDIGNGASLIAEEDSA